MSRRHVTSFHHRGEDYDLLQSDDGTYAYVIARLGDVVDHLSGLSLDELEEVMAEGFPVEVETHFKRALQRRPSDAGGEAGE